MRRFSKYRLVCSGLEEFICGAYYFSFLFKFYLFLFNFSSVILISAPKRDEESEESGNLMRYMEKEWLTTASLSRGWVPETQRSQLLDGDFSHGCQILATQLRAYGTRHTE